MNCKYLAVLFVVLKFPWTHIGHHCTKLKNNNKQTHKTLLEIIQRSSSGRRFVFFFLANSFHVIIYWFGIRIEIECECENRKWEEMLRVARDLQPSMWKVKCGQNKKKTKIVMTAITSWAKNKRKKKQVTQLNGPAFVGFVPATTF